MRAHGPHPDRLRVAQRGDGGDRRPLRAHPPMIDRIEDIARDARSAIDAATSTGALEQVRVQYLGRKAELPNLLRGVAELPPEERRPVRQPPNMAPRQLEEAIPPRQAELEARELE